MWHMREISVDSAVFIIKSSITVSTFGFHPGNVYVCSGGPDGAWWGLADGREMQG